MNYTASKLKEFRVMLQDFAQYKQNKAEALLTNDAAKNQEQAASKARNLYLDTIDLLDFAEEVDILASIQESEETK